jgi:hypothetical protein
MKKRTKKVSVIQMMGAQSSGSSLKAAKKLGKSKSVLPEMISEASETNDRSASRRDIAGSIERTDRFNNIDDGLVPFRNSNAIYGPNKSTVDIRDAVILCQKCYYNFALFRNMIDLMTEFSIDEIRYSKGTKQSRDFFDALFNKLNIWDLQDKFFREYYRSGNVFIYRFDAEVKPNDIRRIAQSMAVEVSFDKDPDKNPTTKAKRSNLVGDPMLDQNQPLGQPTTNGNPLNQDGKVKLEIEPMVIPARYIILNPADINMLGTANFSYGIYYKVMTEYEVSKLRNLQTEEDIEVFNSLPKFTQDQIRAGVRSVYIPLDTKKVKIIFYKKQDYEPFAVPMGYPVLEDINAKIEMRRIDMAITRTMQQIVLLVTAGAEPDKGGINQKNLETLKALFTNQSVGRVLIADYTTKAEFIVPKISELLDPRKYEVIDRDINIGLNNIFFGTSGEKFANQSKKIDVFIKRLQQAKEAFIHHFLWPEMKRIAKSLGFRSCPVPYYDENQFRDVISDSKIYAHLVDIGVLTPEQGIVAIQDNELPEPDDMAPAQVEYKKARDKGLYVPLIGGQKNQDGVGEGKGAGRPSGSTGIPQGTKKMSPMGARGSEEPKTEFSLAALKENMLLSQEVEKDICSYLKKKHKVKKLTEAQASVAGDILTVIVANEEPQDWKSSVVSYCDNPIDTKQSKVNQVLKVAAEHQLDTYVAGLLYSSRKIK